MIKQHEAVRLVYYINKGAEDLLTKQVSSPQTACLCASYKAQKPSPLRTGTFTFFLVQSEVDVGLLLHTVGETVKRKQVAFPVVPLKVESPVRSTREVVER